MSPLNRKESSEPQGRSGYPGRDWLGCFRAEFRGVGLGCFQNLNQTTPCTTWRASAGKDFGAGHLEINTLTLSASSSASLMLVAGSDVSCNPAGNSTGFMGRLRSRWPTPDGLKCRALKCQLSVAHSVACLACSVETEAQKLQEDEISFGHVCSTAEVRSSNRDPI